VVGLAWGAVELLESTATEKTLIDDPVRAVLVDTTNGDVIVLAGNGGELVVERTEHWAVRRPTVEVAVHDEVARVTARCSWMPLSRCAVDVRITVPAGVRVEALTSNGRIALTGIDGWILANTTNGSVTGTGLRSPEVLTTTTNGDVSLEFAEAPSRVVVATSNGDVDLVLPGGPYRSTLATSNGATSVDVPVDEFAERTVEAVTSNGDIALRAG